MNHRQGTNVKPGLRRGPQRRHSLTKEERQIPRIYYQFQIKHQSFEDFLREVNLENDQKT